MKCKGREVARRQRCSCVALVQKPPWKPCAGTRASSCACSATMAESEVQGSGPKGTGPFVRRAITRRPCGPVRNQPACINGGENRLPQPDSPLSLHNPSAYPTKTLRSPSVPSHRLVCEYLGWQWRMFTNTSVRRPAPTVCRINCTVPRKRAPKASGVQGQVYVHRESIPLILLR